MSARVPPGTRISLIGQTRCATAKPTWASAAVQGTAPQHKNYVVLPASACCAGRLTD
jgi:hypothetical protein